MTDSSDSGDPAFELDPVANRLILDGRTIPLPPMVVRFLELLVGARGEVVERDRIIDELWRGDFLTGNPALNRVVSEARSAVGDDARNPRLIQTVHRRGYRLVIVPRRGTREDRARTPGHDNRRLWLILAIAILLVVALILVQSIVENLIAGRFLAGH